jgi:hypothetical protein
LTYLTRSHHHATTDGVERIRGNTSTGGDSPAESERSKEVTLKRTDEDDRLDGIVHAEVQTTVDDDASDGWEETAVQTGNTVRGKGLLVDVDETVELALTTLLGGLGVVGETGTGVVEGVDEEEGGSTGSLDFNDQSSCSRWMIDESAKTYTTRSQVTGHPLPVTITLLLEGEHGLVGVAESEVQGLGWEVTDDVGSVTSPQRDDTLLLCGSSEALNDAIVLAVKTASLDHLILYRIIVS